MININAYIYINKLNYLKGKYRKRKLYFNAGIILCINNYIILCNRIYADWEYANSDWSRMRVANRWRGLLRGWCTELSISGSRMLQPSRTLRTIINWTIILISSRPFFPFYEFFICRTLSFGTSSITSIPRWTCPSPALRTRKRGGCHTSWQCRCHRVRIPLTCAGADWNSVAGFMLSHPPPSVLEYSLKNVEVLHNFKEIMNAYKEFPRYKTNIIHETHGFIDKLKHSQIRLTLIM